MFCPECGKIVEEGMIFCPDCGVKVGETLPSFSVKGTQIIKKPMGIIFILFFSIFLGFLNLIPGLILNIAGYLGLGIISKIPFLGEQFLGEIAKIEISKSRLFLMAVFGYFLLFTGIFYFTAAYGIGIFSEWGRKLASWLYIITILISLLLPIIIGLPLIFGSAILGLIWIGVLLIILSYLSKPDIKALFK